MNLRQKIALFILISGMPTLGISQIEFSLKLNYDSTKWGVFAKPAAVITPSSNTLTGSGQVTVVAPKGFVVTGIHNYGGTWSQNARSNSPDENPDFDYISFGLSSDFPKILYQQGFETLLFSFANTGPCPDTLHLMANDDPFSSPNSAGSNPNNEILVIDSGRDENYFYSKNYDLCAWACKPCDLPGNTSSSNHLPVESGIVIYPNPTFGNVTIESAFTSEKVTNVTVTDFSGTIVFRKDLISNSVDLSHLPVGIYFFNMLTESEVIITKKIFIVK